ncbi:MAG: flagellar hook-associated protein FlgL [Ideonella sp.]|nr:flagellar hook-associated protein FlgL [Ideonella sp.]
MRIATASRYDATIDSLQRRQAALTDSQDQMSSGRRVNKPSDDPTAASRAERAHILQQRIEAQRRAIEYSGNAIRLAESALGQAGDVLQSARETLVNAGNGSYNATERDSLAKHLKQLRGQLLSQANQADGNGGYTFGGQGSQNEPFLDQIGGVAFAGTGGQMQLSSSEEMPGAVDGKSVWLGARTGNGIYVTGADPANTGHAWIDSGGVTDPSAITGHDYSVVFSDSGGGAMTYSVLDGGAPTAIAGQPYSSSAPITVDGMTFRVTGNPADGDRFTIVPSQAGLDPFSVLDKAIAVLSDPNANSGQISQAVSSGLRDLDSVMGHMQSARSEAGATLSRLDSIDSREQDSDLWAKSVQSSAEDLDMVSAISDFKNKQTNYQAALQTYATVQRMSLFDYIK